MTPQQYCEHKVLREGSSLYYSLRFLPTAQRQALTALNAFFQEVSDIRYECGDANVAHLKWQWWQNEVAQTFTETAQHPVCQALSKPIRHYQLAQHYFQEIIDGLLLDNDKTHYATFEELESYCRRTGGVLSLLMTQVLGYQNDSTLKYAEQLGIALQLTKLLRQIRRDLEYGRLYLAEEELARFNVNQQSLFNYQTTETTQALFAYQAIRIRDYFNNALKYLGKEDRYRQRSGIIRAELAMATLQEIENDGFQLFKHDIHLTPVRKLWIAWRTGGLARWQRIS